jgi:nicotinate-nucleotide adenylyltransferase
MRVALFGGSFDPPHLGHVFAACYAKIVGGVDEVWVFPVAKHAYNKSLSPWAQRFALCQAAFADFPFIKLRDDELRNHSGYTFDLLTRLIDIYPTHHWHLVGGSDTAQDLPNWHRGQELAKRIAVIPVPRRGYDDHPAALPQISSTAVRERLAQQQTVQGFVTQRVAQLIEQHRWYR